MRAKKAEAGGRVPARLLVDCQFGRHGEVVEFDAQELEAAVFIGVADPSPEAVAYARQQ